MSYMIKNLLKVSRYAPKQGKHLKDKVLQDAFVMMRIGPKRIDVGHKAKISDEIFAANKEKIEHLEKVGAITVTRIGGEAPKAPAAAPVKAAPKKVEPVKVEPKKVEPVKVEVAKPEPKVVEAPKVEEPKAEEAPAKKEAPAPKAAPKAQKPARKKTTSPREAAKKAAAKKEK